MLDGDACSELQLTLHLQHGGGGFYVNGYGRPAWKAWSTKQTRLTLAFDHLYSSVRLHDMIGNASTELPLCHLEAAAALSRAPCPLARVPSSKPVSNRRDLAWESCICLNACVGRWSPRSLGRSKLPGRNCRASPSLNMHYFLDTAMPS